MCIPFNTSKSQPSKIASAMRCIVALEVGRHPIRIVFTTFAKDILNRLLLRLHFRHVDQVVTNPFERRPRHGPINDLTSWPRALLEHPLVAFSTGSSHYITVSVPHDWFPEGIARVDIAFPWRTLPVKVVLQFGSMRWHDARRRPVGHLIQQLLGVPVIGFVDFEVNTFTLQASLDPIQLVVQHPAHLVSSTSSPTSRSAPG